MSKFNYSKQFAKKDEKSVENAAVQNEEVKPVNGNVDTETPGEDHLTVPPKMGAVNCAKLNVRKGPSKETEIVAVIDMGREVVIEEELPDWYKVRIAGNIVGYCMLEFITAK